MRSRSNSRDGIGVLSRDDGVRVESPEEVAEEFNEYFSSVFSVEELGSVPRTDGGPVMHLGRGNPGGSYVMNGGTFGAVNEERDLGARITSDLKTYTHCA